MKKDERESGIPRYMKDLGEHIARMPGGAKGLGMIEPDVNLGVVEFWVQKKRRRRIG